MTVDRSQCLVIEPVEKEANGLNGLSLKSVFHLDDSLSKLVMEEAVEQRVEEVMWPQRFETIAD